MTLLLWFLISSSSPCLNLKILIIITIIFPAPEKKFFLTTLQRKYLMPHAHLSPHVCALCLLFYGSFVPHILSHLPSRLPLELLPMKRRKLKIKIFDKTAFSKTWCRVIKK